MWNKVHREPKKTKPLRHTWFLLIEFSILFTVLIRNDQRTYCYEIFSFTVG